MGLTRRQFLQLTGATAAGAVVFVGCSPRSGELLVESASRLPEDMVTGIDNWYATICRMCPAGCGVIVRVMEGRAKKIEGNPDYPVNRGKLCARGQAGLQVLYHPDRIQGPLRRKGDRGSGQFEPISWETALNELAGKLKAIPPGPAIQYSGPPGLYAPVTLLTGPLRGHLPRLLDSFSKASGVLISTVVLEPFDQSALRLGLGPVTGAPPLPFLDLQQSRFILSFGADFLGSWLSPVHYGTAYGQFRARSGARGTLIQVEPRITSTGASADRWIPIKPGTEGVLAMGLAQVMISQRLVPAEASQQAGLAPDSSLLQNYQPASVSETTGVPVGDIVSLARRFASEKPSLAIAGGPALGLTNASATASAVTLLNRLVGSAGQAGGALSNPRSPDPNVPETSGGFGWVSLLQAMRTGQPVPAPPTPTDKSTFAPPSVLLVRGANPVHELPPTYGFRDALARVPYIASFSSFMDETTAMADLVLPEPTYLEDWGSDIPEPAPGFQVMGFQQPVVNPVYDTRSFGDVVLAVAGLMGAGKDIPWKTFKELLREGARTLMSLKRGSVQAPGFEEYWIKLLQQGGWWDEGTEGTASAPVPFSGLSDAVSPVFYGSEQIYPFHLLPFPSHSLGAGAGAHVPWLQATPDPVSTVVWQTWVEVNLEVGRGLGLQEGDIVRVESPLGGLEAPVYLHPGIRPDVVAIPMGQGHTSYGRYARDRGANVMSLVYPMIEQGAAGMPWAATRVRLSKTEKSVRVSKAEGLGMAGQPPDVEIVGVVHR
ncbi:MAG: molybdopterin-dependent oxidoreductase [Dehalococcoidia bacterium]|nr:molybdopterin-dependent oxidoreductase [Dehalococcoidia bacterium]